MSSYEEKIKQQAQQYLDGDERVLAAFIARPRGATTAGAGGVAAGMIGARKVNAQRDAAADAGLTLANPMALALTDRRLLVLGVSAPLAMGKGGDVKELVSSVPVGHVESIEVKRLLMGRTVTLTAGGTSFKLETSAGADAKRLADEFERTRATA